MKRLLGIFIFVVGISAVGQVPDLSKMDIVERSVPDGPVAIVLGTPIDKGEFLTRYKTELLEYVMMTGNREPSDIERVRIAIKCLTVLAKREILYQEALKKKYTATEEEVKKEMEEQVNLLKGVLKSEGKKDPTFEDVLRLRGDTLESFRERTRKNVLLEKVKQAIASEKKISVSEAEVKEFYEKNPQLFVRPTRVHLQHIYKMPKPNAKTANETAWAEAKKDIEKALARIRAGENFEAVARSMSDAPDKEQGGDMGWMPMSGLPPFYVEVVTRLQPGEISEPVKSSLGWHLVRLLERESEQKISLEKVKENIRKMIYERKLDEAIYDFCKPYLNDSEKVKFFLALEPVLRRLGIEDTQKQEAVSSTTPSSNSGGSKYSSSSSNPSSRVKPSSRAKSSSKGGSPK